MKNFFGNRKKAPEVREAEAKVKADVEKAKGEATKAKKEKKAEAKAKKQHESAEEKYSERRDKLLIALKNLSRDEETLGEVLSAVVKIQEQNKDPKASRWKKFANKINLAASGAKFVGKHASDGMNLLKSASFFSKNPEFLNKFLQDPTTQMFIAGNGIVLDKLLESATPQLTKILLNQYGDVASVEKKIQDKEKDFEQLPSLEEDLRLLKTQDRPFKPETAQRIDEIEKKIKPLKDLQNQLQIAKTIRELKLQGVEVSELNELLQPAVSAVTKELLKKHPEKFAEIVKLGGQFLQEVDPVVKNRLFGQILEQVDITEMATNPSFVRALEVSAPKLVKVVERVMVNSPSLAKFVNDAGVTPKLREEAISLGVSLASKALVNRKDIAPVIDAVKNLASSDVAVKLPNAGTIEEVRALDKKGTELALKVAATLPNLLVSPQMFGIIKAELPKFLSENQAALGDLLSRSVPTLLANLSTNASKLISTIPPGKFKFDDLEQALTPAPVKFLSGVDPKFYKKLADSLIPVVSEALKALPDRDKANKIYENIKILNTVPDERMPQEEQDRLKESKAQALSVVVRAGVEILSNKDVSEAVVKVGSGLLQDKDTHKAFGQILTNAQKYNPDLKTQVHNLGIEDKLQKNIIALASNSVGKILTKTPEIATLYNDVSQLNDELLTRDQLYNVADNLGKILDKPFIDVFTEDIPKFLKSNEKDIETAIGNFYERNPVLAKKYEDMGIDKEFAQTLAKAGGTIAADLLPLVAQGAKDLVTDKKANKKGLVDFLETVNNYAKADGTFGKLASGASVAGAMYNLMESNSNFRAILNNQIPQTLDRHAEKFGPVIDKFLSKTSVGKNLTIKGVDVLRTMQTKIPQVNELISNVDKGNTVKAVVSGLKIMCDPKVLSLTGTLIGDMARYGYQKNIISDKARQSQCGAQINDILTNLLQNIEKDKDNKLQDLGKLLEKQVSQDQRPSLQYSLKNHDFRGLHLKDGSLNLEKFKINDFRFKNTKFDGKVSFENSEISNTSFQNAVFKDGASFKGATIDAKTLETLLPVIRAHNIKHADNKITLDHVKITGDISKLDLKNISLKDADLSHTKIVEVTKKAKEVGKNIVSNNPEGQVNIGAISRAIKPNSPQKSSLPQRGK